MTKGPFNLTDKNIIVTGASSGIGRAIAVACSVAGANIIMFARSEDRLKETNSLLFPGNHTYFSIDLTNYGSIEKILDTCTYLKGNVHGFVHAAGAEFSAPYNMTRPEHYEQLLRINVISGFEFLRILVHKKFIDQVSGGSGVFISSIRALFGQEGSLAYSTSKGALISGIRTLSLELARKKIRVNAILPSIVKTPMIEQFFSTIPEESVKAMKNQHPLGFGEPVDVANCCLYLLSDGSRWMTGNNLILDGGYSVR